ncbi:hypothetical protein [Pseudomonas sp. LRF_L74]|uniref:hypothetical protein n=1 Tax=Pseudomonas sp. LRF_L74 TaxID=3369422 RepID=UPI003F604BBD
MHTPLSIALHGFAAAEKAAITHYLKRRLPHSMRVVEADAQLPIVNLDSHEGEGTWQRVAGRQGLPSIVLSMKERRLPLAHWLSRPLELVALVALVEHLSMQRKAVPALADSALRLRYSAASDDRYHDPALRDELFYAPQEYFQGDLARALGLAAEDGRALRIEGGGMGLTVCAGGRQVSSAYRDSQLARLSFLRSEDCLLRPCPEVPSDERLQAADALLWRLAIRTARGRVPHGTSLDEPVGLRRWPNFTRLQRPPHALRIVAQWQVRPLGLLATAQALDVPCHAVFSIYSGCWALGLLQAPTSEAVAQPVASLPARIFTALLGRLRRRAGEKD